MNLRPSGYEPDELPDCSTPRRALHGTGASANPPTRPAAPARARVRHNGDMDADGTSNDEELVAEAASLRAEVKRLRDELSRLREELRRSRRDHHEVPPHHL